MKKKKGLTQIVVKNVFFQSLSGIVSKIGALIFTIIIARLLFPELFGLYSLTLAIILTIVSITDLGLGGTIVRYISESLGKKIKKRKKQKEVRSRFFFLMKFKFILALAVSILLFLLSGLIAGLFKKPELVLPLQIGSIYLFITSIYGTISSLFLALQKVKYSTITEIIFQASRVGLIAIFLYFYKTVAFVFAVLAISSLFALIFAFIIINKKYKFLIKGKKEPVERRRLLTFSGFLAISSLSAIIFVNIDKLMLGYFLPSQFIGYYAAIITLVSGVLGLIGFSGVVFPAFTQLNTTIEKLKRAFKKTFHYLIILAFPATIGIAYIFIPALQILYGQAYVPLEYRITLLITSVFLSFLILEGIFSNLYIILFNAKEKPKFPAITMSIVTVLNIVLNFVFIFYLIKIKPEYGLIGAAAATFISRYIFLGSLMILSKKKLKISPNKISFIKPFLASLVMLAFLFIYDYFVPLNLVRGIVMILGAIIIYFGIMFLIRGIKKEDFKLIRMLKS